MKKRWNDIYIYIYGRKKLNNRGFTLVELLVTIAILGIIAGMSFPMLRKLSEANQQKKYKVYAQSLNSSAKLYVDSYGEDLFGSAPYGCATVTYDELKNKLATKDIQTSNLSCFSDKTFVTVRKSHDNYSYYSQIGCGTKKSDSSKLNDSEVTVTYSLGDNTGDCSETSSGYTLTSDPKKDEDKDKKSIDVNVIIQNSITGINKADGSVNLSYKWTTEKNANVNDSDWKKVKFNSIPTNSKQEKEILKGNSITIKSNDISTPSGATGIYYLAVKQDTIYDIYMSDIVKAEDKTKVTYLGPFIIDNTKPDINTFTISSKNSSYNSLNTTVNISATDNNSMTPNNKLKVCVYESSNSSKKCEYKTYSDSSKASANLNLSGNQDGKTRKIKIVAEDLAGNKTEKTITYTPATKYNITYNLNGGTNAKGNPSIAYTGQEITIAKPTKTVTAKFNDNKTGATINPNKNITGKYTFSGWTGSGLNTNSAKTGINSADKIWNGTATTNTKFKNLTTTYNKTVTMSASYKGPTITLPTITKTGYTCKWNSSSNCSGSIEKKSEGTYTPSSVTERIFYACCTKNSYKLTYNDNGGSGCSSKSITKQYNDTWGKLCTPSKTGYTFNGWYNGNTIVTSSTKVGSSNITVKAKWKVNSYTLTINNNGGSGCSNQTKNYGDKWDTCTPSRTHYSFKSWSSNFAGTTVTGDKSVNANWTPTQKCPDGDCYISSSGSDSNWGTKDSPFATIQAGFDNVTDGKSIILLSSITNNDNNILDRKISVTLKSDGNNKYTISRSSSNTIYIIRQNISGSNLTINNIIFDSKKVSAKGTMVTFLKGTTTTVNNCEFKNANNDSARGSCIYFDFDTNTVLNDVKIYDNYNKQGGVAINGRGKITLNNVKIYNNSCNDGTIWNYGTVVMNSGEIYNNSATWDAGVRNFGKFYMYGGSIHNNSATKSTGGLLNSCYHFTNEAGYREGTSLISGGAIYSNSPRDTNTDYVNCPV